MTTPDRPADPAVTRMDEEDLSTAKTIKRSYGGFVPYPPQYQPIPDTGADTTDTESEALTDTADASPADSMPDQNASIAASEVPPTPAAHASGAAREIAPPQPARWGEREPDDPEFPAPHVHAEHMPGATGWRLAGASIRGKMHAHEGRYREDHWHAATTANGAYNLIAVADGGGSYTLSRVGAEVAAKSAIATLVERLPTTEIRQRFIEVVIEDALGAAYDAIAQEAARIAEIRPGTTAKDLSTTLLVIAHHPELRLLCVGQIGDGLILVYPHDDELYAIGEAEVGAAAGEVVFLNNIADRNWAKRVRGTTMPGPLRFLAVMTDGLADDVIESQRNQEAFAQGIRENLYTAAPEEALLQLLRYEKRGSFDDRTLVVAYPTQAAGAQWT